MIKRILFFFTVCCVYTIALKAQDTSAYQIQRLKVNALLAQRSAKFGQYDHSLNMRTGIFGFQTKRDIRNSNEILRQIALTDNAIFQELKVLMNYKDLQVEQVRTTVDRNSENIINYRKTIKDLQDQNQKYAADSKRAENKSSIGYLLLTILLITCCFLGYRLRLLKKRIMSLTYGN